jgi:hypothetical protein
MLTERSVVLSIFWLRIQINICLGLKGFLLLLREIIIMQSLSATSYKQENPGLQSVTVIFIDHQENALSFKNCYL